MNMATLWQDVRYGLRMLGRSPGFAAVVLLVVGLGIGANTALFNALDQVYLRPLPVQKPHELVSVQFRYRHGAWETVGSGFSHPTYEAYRDGSQVFADLVAFTGTNGMGLRLGNEAKRIEGVGVSVNYFSCLGVRPALGRLWMPGPEQGDEAVDPVAVISHRLWRREFGGQADAVGKQIVLNDRVLTIIGVAPAGFTGTIVGQVPDVYLPLAVYADDQALHDSEYRWVNLLGRLKPGVDRAQAQAALQVLDAQINPPKPGEPEITALVFDGSRGYVPKNAQVAVYPLGLFLGMAVLVFVIACVNIANLQLARAATRHKEIAVRQALGAGRRRVLRQLLVENVLLALAGGACGILLAVCLGHWICAVLTRIASATPLPSDQLNLTGGLHLRMLLFALGISLTAGIAFGLAPALALLRRDVVVALKESAGCADLPARRWNPHSLLVVGQIALSLVVMAFSVLCLRSLIGLHHTDPGYDTRQILVARLDLDGWLLDRPDLCRSMADLQERVSRLPGVASASLAVCPPVSETSGGRNVIDIEGAEVPLKGEINWRVNVVGPGYFQTLGQALLAGRVFTARDGPEAPKVIVINEVMAKQYWPSQNPIGKRVRFFVGEGEDADVREVVGVVKGVKLRSILEEPAPIAYLALDQQTSKKWKATPVLLVRTQGDPHAVIPTIRQEAVALGVPAALDIRTVAERISGLLRTQQLLAAILNLFGFVGLLLSATGIYAVMAYAVRQRTREIGIRIALGARGQDVVVPVLLRGTVLLIIGLGLGVGLSLAGTRLLASRLWQIREWDRYFLQGITTWDPVTYAGTILVIVAVTLTACYLPARRAARVDPMVALRCE